MLLLQVRATNILTYAQTKSNILIYSHTEANIVTYAHSDSYIHVNNNTITDTLT